MSRGVVRTLFTARARNCVNGHALGEGVAEVHNVISRGKVSGMGIEDCDWKNHKDIERWMAEWREEVEYKTLDFTGKDDPIDELRHRLERGDFAGKNKASVEAFLKTADSKAHRVSDQGKADREERAIAAAERSARWAGWAIVVALAALAVSAWPYIKEWLS